MLAESAVRYYTMNKLYTARDKSGPKAHLPCNQHKIESVYTPLCKTVASLEKLGWDVTQQIWKALCQLVRKIVRDTHTPSYSAH